APGTALPDWSLTSTPIAAGPSHGFAGVVASWPRRGAAATSSAAGRNQRASTVAVASRITALLLPAAMAGSPERLLHAVGADLRGSRTFSLTAASTISMRLAGLTTYGCRISRPRSCQ